MDGNVLNDFATNCPSVALHSGYEGPRDFRSLDTPGRVLPMDRHGLVLGAGRIRSGHGGGLLALLPLG